MGKLSLSIAAALICTVSFVGCSSSSDNSNNTSQTKTSFTVERGAVLEAKVTDANGKVAVMNGMSNKYEFTGEFSYPITVSGGYIDVDGSGDKSVGDLNLTSDLKTDFGTNITMVTTAISNPNKEARDKSLDDMATSLGVSKEELLKLPSQSFDSAILSNELYEKLKQNSNLTLKDIADDLDSMGIKTKFLAKKSSMDTNADKKEFALDLEKEYISKLAKDGKVNTISFDDIKGEIKDGAYELSIFHVNDTHSHIPSEQMSFYINNEKTYVNVGGYPRMVTKIDELKGAKPNSLVLNAGDVFQGTLYYSLFKGEADAAAMNLINWDAYALGNHEFDDSDEGLKSFLDRLTTSKVISANVVPKAGNILENYWTPYVIKEINSQKVGIIGIDIVGKTKNSSNPSDEIEFLDEVETAQKYIDELKEKHEVNKIVLLTHQGYSNDIKMAKALSGVDIIVGGDSHSLLGDFSDFGLNSSSNDYPTKVRSKDNKKVCIVQAWEYGHVVGDLDVVFNKQGEVVACDGNPLLLIGDEFKQKNSEGSKVVVSQEKKSSILDVVNSNENIVVVQEDTNALSVIKTFEDQVDSKKAIKVGTALEKLGHNRIPGDKKDGSSILPLGSDIAPIVAKSFYDLSNLADACIQNAGGVRVAINEGDITMGDAYTLLPFANTLFEIKMKGSEIKQVLEDALTNTFKEGGSTGSFPYSYALRYDIDVSKGDNNMISNLEIKDRQTQTWGNIQADKMYTIVTNSYTAAGKDGYVTFKTVQDERGVGVDTYLDYAMSFVRYVEAKAKNNESVSKLPSSDHPVKSFKDANGNEVVK